MTIGIAAAGPGAGAAILDALARVEAVAEGAVGGFVSMAVITAEGIVERAEIQRGGARTLLSRPQPAVLLEAPLAVLMSSGPDRPEPLTQFTPALPGIGLVTGHRFPNVRGADGRPLAEEALDHLRNGMHPQAAAEAVAARNPKADAGLIVLGLDGQIGMANADLVRRHADLGKAVVRSEGYAVGVMHNSIEPYDVVARLTVTLVERRLRQADAEMATLRIAVGLPVRASAARSRLAITKGRATAMEVATAYNGDLSWSAGLGPAADIVEDGRIVGHAQSDPFLLVRDERLVAIDGRSEGTIAYRRSAV